MTEQLTPHFCEVDIDEETSALWESGIKEFLKKGGLASTVKDRGGPGFLDLNVLLPTFADIAKLNLHTEYVIDRLIPKESLTMIHARGGLGKTWLAQQFGGCVAEGRPFVGLSTQKMAVYYADYENSLSLDCERTKILGPSSMRLWHISNSISPPHLDSDDWILFKSLFPGLLIFDTLRSAQLLDENSSKDMALIMGRLKELRDMGFTIVLLHHTQKADARTYKGSSAILDLCDHVLGLERVKEVGSDTIVDDDEADLPFRLGTREKTRYEPFSIFLKFDPSLGFYPAGDPDEALLGEMKSILEGYYGKNQLYPNQTDFFRRVKDDLEIRKGQFRRLLRKGSERFWTEVKGLRNASIYRPISVFQSKNEPSNSVFQKGQQSSLLQAGEKTEFSSFPDTSKKTKKTDQIQFSSFPPLFIEEKTKQLENKQNTEDGFEVREDGELTY